MCARIVVFISGNGSNLQAIIDACENKLIPAEVVHVFSNKPGVMGLERASAANVPSTVCSWNKKTETRSEYDQRVAAMVERLQPNLIVLAGWMHLFSSSFLCKFHTQQVINLHPALPGTFPGAHAIEDAFAQPELMYSGVMVHTVVEEMDAGEVIAQLRVAKYPQDTLDQFRERVQQAEKPVLVHAIGVQLATLIGSLRSKNPFVVPKMVTRGKVRDMYDMGLNVLLMHATDRCSSFDRHICDIPQKGNIINRVSCWWFERTRHIIPNHVLHNYPEFAATAVKRCDVFPIEFVVRGYITGTTNTAMWTLYEAGVRTFGDVHVCDGLHKNEQLAHPIVTPTTKSANHDEPIDSDTIIARGLMTPDQYAYCHRKALELFQFGQAMAAQHGLILVDTKYEFGVDVASSQILLVDELHTCDSSRYWKSDTYEERFEQGLEPDRFDKDVIRLYVKSQCDPYAAGSVIPPIPKDVIDSVASVYSNFYQQLLCADGGENVNAPPPPVWPLNDIALSALQTRYFKMHHPHHVHIVFGGGCGGDVAFLKAEANNLHQLLRSHYKINATVEQHNPFSGTNELLRMLGTIEKRSATSAVKHFFVVVGSQHHHHHPDHDHHIVSSSLKQMITHHSTCPVLSASGKLGFDADMINRLIKN